MTDLHRLAAYPLLAAACVYLAWLIRGRRHAAVLFATRYRRWCTRQWLGFALPSVAALAMIGRLPAIAALPAEFAPLAGDTPPLAWSDLGPLALGGAIGVGLGSVGIWLARWWRRRRGRPAAAPWTLGDLSAILPRDARELAWAAVLAVSAGVCEELAFRLALPLLLAIVTGGVATAFAIATIGFGAMHRYQGWVGVIATTAIGVLLSAVYLATRTLWAAMLVHVLIDLNGLVLRPALAGVWRRR